MITRYSLMILLFATLFSLSISWRNDHVTEEPSAPSHKEAFQTRLEENFKPNSILSPFTPVRICIPAVRLSAKVIPVGLQKDGRLGVPKSSHVDDYKGPGIFYPLKKVKPGSMVLLFDAKDNVLVYRVEQNESYYKKMQPLSGFSGIPRNTALILLRARAFIIGIKMSMSSA